MRTCRCGLGRRVDQAANRKADIARLSLIGAATERCFCLASPRASGPTSTTTSCPICGESGEAISRLMMTSWKRRLLLVMRWRLAMAKLRGRARLRSEIVEAMRGLHKIGIINNTDLEKTTLRMLGRDALPKVTELSPTEIAPERPSHFFRKECAATR